MSVEAAIRDKLNRAFAPTRLEVVNESDLHAGHRSSPGTGESHFRVLIVSSAFAGKARVERHRRVNEALAAELKGKVHALAIKAYAPGEELV
ncbi:MAG: BolA family transcriptional regulator [Hyphomicrobiaceae bacterium]|nr:MAG: BolA family transcriptional regulator [Hyphomicrobiaceae bacterium]